MSTKGLDSFLDVFEVIKDPKKYEAKVQELTALTKQYKEVVEAVVSLASVNDYTKTIKEREEASKKELEDAKAQANEIRNTAATKAKEKLATLVTREATVVQAESEFASKVKNFEARVKEVEARVKENEERAAYVESQRIKLVEAEKALAERQAKLAEALK